jgi:RHS repeat-associated protein
MGVAGSQCADETEHHFTGNERDSESGNDYFKARYYASSMGRFLSPDWSAKDDPVPFDLKNPQTLNLYAHVDDNPLTKSDPDGHMECAGGQHNPLWCLAHKLGFVETPQEQRADQANEDLNFIAANGIDAIKVNGHWQPAASSSDSDIAIWWKDYNDSYRDALNQGMSPVVAMAALGGRLGGGNGPSRLTNAQVNDLAKWSGMEPAKDVPFDSHGQKIF